MAHVSNFQRWFALGVESNAWSLVLAATAASSPLLLGLWLALSAYAVASSAEGQRDVRDPDFAVFPLPASQELYLWFSVEVFGWLGIGLPLVGVYLVFQQLPNRRVARVVDALVALLLASLVALAVLLAAAKQSADHQRQLVQTRDSSVVAPFNAYYCEVRGVWLCADQTVDTARLREVFAGEGDDTASATENVVRGCRYALHELYNNAASHEAWLAVHRQRVFMSSCNTSAVVDSWCGEFLLAKAAGSDDDTLARLGDVAVAATPASINDERFREFETAWRSHIDFDSILLGVVGAGLLAFCVAWTKMLESDKREWALPTQDADAKKNM